MSKPFKYREGIGKTGKAFISVGKWDRASKKYRYTAYSNEKVVKRLHGASKKQQTSMRKREEYNDAWDYIQSDVLKAGGTRAQALKVYKSSRKLKYSKRDSREFTTRHSGTRTSIKWFYQYTPNKDIKPVNVGDSPGVEGDDEPDVTYAAYNKRLPGNEFHDNLDFALHQHEGLVESHKNGEIFLWEGGFTITYYNAETGKNIIRPEKRFFRGR